jgi:2-dehydro-3-deoxyphosphogluconate aldolase / (4S)-4-hydroxy-2-oxoglutarate aldolase
VTEPARLSHGEVTAALERHGIVAVIRLTDATALRPVIDALAAGGVRALEVTMTVPGATELIAEIAPTLPRGFLIGAGTVLDAAAARRVIAAGAQFVVSPVFSRGVLEECRRFDVAVVPGCFSPTEMLEAWNAGADMVKIFPATALGPAFLRDVRAPLPHLKLMPTGGVSIENAGDWIRAGAAAVGIGSALLDAAAIAQRRFATITGNAERLVANVASARASQR